MTNKRPDNPDETARLDAVGDDEKLSSLDTQAFGQVDDDAASMVEPSEDETAGMTEAADDGLSAGEPTTVMEPVQDQGTKVMEPVGDTTTVLFSAEDEPFDLDAALAARDELEYRAGQSAAWEYENVTQSSAVPEDVVASRKPVDKKKVAVIVAIVLALAVVAAVTFFFANQYVQHKNDRKPVKVEAAFEFDKTGALTDLDVIGVPVQVTGVDMDGNEVDRKELAKPDGFSTRLVAGEYEIGIFGNPVTEAGDVYSWPTTVVSVKIEPGQDGAEETEDGKPQATFKFEVVPADKVTDEMIADIESWMGELDTGYNPATIIQSIMTKRLNETSRLEQEAQAQAAEKEKAAAEAERQTALSSNPSSIAASAESGTTVSARLTGVVHTGYRYAGSAGQDELVCWLELPSNVTFDFAPGPQSVSTNRVILPDSFEGYLDKTITISNAYVLLTENDSADVAVSRVQSKNSNVLHVYEQEQ